jgi:hypothetical protein
MIHIEKPVKAPKILTTKGAEQTQQDSKQADNSGVDASNCSRWNGAVCDGAPHGEDVGDEEKPGQNDLSCELLAVRSAEHFFVSCRCSEELMAHSSALLYCSTKSS